jgi:predicted enzyme related to lactoylglutathione lyase
VSPFCWHDLAAAEPAAALSFYETAFGWTSAVQRANGGSFFRLRADGRDVGSMYPLSRAQRDAGVPSHWTSYVRTDGIQRATRRVLDAGGRVLVSPFAVHGMASIALIADPTGALFGLWEDPGHARQRAD